MRRTGQTAQRRPHPRLLGLLAVLLGMLGMHGLASAHHAAVVPSHRTAAAAVTTPDAASLTAGASSSAGAAQLSHGAGLHLARHVVAAVAVATAGEAPQLASVDAAVPGCDEHCPDGVAVLCAAVLAVAAAASALAAAAARRPVPTRRDRGARRARAPAGARWLRLTPDPVAELCISRT